MSDVSKRLKPSFVKKAELEKDGPRRVTITGTTEVESNYGDGREFCVTFHDRTMLSLRSRANFSQLLRLFGNDDAAWVGKEIELYFDPDVPNPNGDPGGVRLCLPTAASAPSGELFRSDLEDDDDAEVHA